MEGESFPPNGHDRVIEEGGYMNIDVLIAYLLDWQSVTEDRGTALGTLHLLALQRCRSRTD